MAKLLRSRGGKEEAATAASQLLASKSTKPQSKYGKIARLPWKTRKGKVRGPSLMFAKEKVDREPLVRW